MNTKTTNINGYNIYSYKIRQNGRLNTLWVVANPNHNYPYECPGRTVYGSISSFEKAAYWANTLPTLNTQQEQAA